MNINVDVDIVGDTPSFYDDSDEYLENVWLPTPSPIQGDDGDDMDWMNIDTSPHDVTIKTSSTTATTSIPPIIHRYDNFHTGWELINKSVLMLCPQRKTRRDDGEIKVAAFDLDDTLIKTKSGKKFPMDEGDWIWFTPDVRSRLKDLCDRGYEIVVFTNQSGIGSRDNDALRKRHQFKTKLSSIIRELGDGFPIRVFVATKDDTFRKPSRGMWDLMLHTFLQETRDDVDSVTIDLPQSFYIGDAAGRMYSLRKDFSSCDYGFAVNVFGRHLIQTSFHTPEFFFKGIPEILFHTPFDPVLFFNNPVRRSLSLTYFPSIPARLDERKNELVILVGPPSSSKSTFAEITFKTMLRGDYEIVNQDTLGLRKKCLSQTNNFLAARRNVVIDNTNPSKKDRAEYISLAKKHGAHIRCFVMEAATNKFLSKHLVQYRHLLGGRSIPDVAINVFFAHFEYPTTDEGYDVEPQLVSFVPLFSSESQKNIFCQILI